MTASATLWRKSCALGSPDTAGSSQTVQPRERSFPRQPFWGWAQRNSATSPPVSLLGSAGVPCLRLHWGHVAPFLTGS